MMITNMVISMIIVTIETMLMILPISGRSLKNCGKLLTQAVGRRRSSRFFYGALFSFFVFFLLLFLFVFICDRFFFFFRFVCLFLFLEMEKDSFHEKLVFKPSILIIIYLNSKTNPKKADKLRKLITLRKLVHFQTDTFPS